jgi:glucose dehydrogenase
MTRPTRRSFRMSLLAVAFALSAYGTAGPAEQAAATRTAWPPDRLNNLTDWGIYRGDKRATQYSSISQINTTNVHRLKVAWQYNHGLPESPGIYSNAIIVDGLLYFTTPRVNVIALDAATGKEVWRFDPAPYNGGRIFRGRNRGVTYWEDEHGRNQRIFAFVRDRVYAIDAKTGVLIEPFGQAGGQFIDLRRDLPVRSELADIEVTTPGTVFENYLIVTSRVPEGNTSTPGDIRAYNAATGKFEWIFNTIPREGQFGYDTWEFEPNMHYGGANVWGGVTVDEQRGWVFAAPGSAAGEFIYGGSRKGDNLFANTVLALNARTGERIWHYQIIRHDIWDYDLPPAPILATITTKSGTRDVVVQLTKMGLTFVLDRDTGKPVFPVVDRRARPLRPFGAGVAQAVVQIEHGILASGGVARGRVDAQHPPKPEGLRIVLNDLHLAVGDVFARDVVAGGRLWINVQTFGRARRLDRAQASAASRSTGPAGSGCSRLGGCRCRSLGSRRRFCGGFRVCGLGVCESGRRHKARRDGEYLRDNG